MPQEMFDAHVEQAKSARGELTSVGVQKTARRWLNEQDRKQIAEGGLPPLPSKTYRCLVVDPPWPMQKIERDVYLI